jgi:DNA gyrase subunit A
MSTSTGLGLLDVMILEAIEAAGARHDRPYLKTQRSLDVLHVRTGIGPNQAYESLCDMARRYVVHLPLVDVHGNYGSPDWGPAAARYTECRLTKLGEAALATERGELGPLPIALINGDLHLGRRRPPLDPRRVIEAVRGAAAGASNDTIVEIVGLPAFPSHCDVTGDVQMFASGGVSEILASAPMLDGHERGRVTVTITALPPFTSASRIAEHIQNAVSSYGKGPPYRPRSIDENGPAPVSDVHDRSADGHTALVAVGRTGASHTEVRRFLDQIPTVHHRVHVELERQLAHLIRDVALPSADLGRRIDLVEQAIDP